MLIINIEVLTICNIPDSNLDQIIYPMKKWVSINAKHFTSYDKDSINENLQEFKQFKKDSVELSHIL